MKKRSILLIAIGIIMSICVSVGITTLTASADNPTIEYKMGDANLDGTVNTRDVVLIKQSIVGIAELTDKQKVFADTYADGVVNTRDVVLIQQYIVGMDVDLGEAHQHTYSEEWSYDEEYHWHAATCEHDVVVDKNAHDFDSKITAVTCTTDGYTTYTCKNCGYSFTDNIVNATGHNPNGSVEENRVEPKCEVKGGYDLVVYCKTCGAELSREHKEIAALQHEFTNYVSDNNATYDSDGTKTAYCNNGCGATDTVIDTGSKLPEIIEYFEKQNDGTYYGKVFNATPTFDFNGKIDYDGDYYVCTDSACTNPLNNNMSSLKVGDNVFYVLFDNGTKTTITVRRRTICTVTFNSAGGTAVSSQTVEEDRHAKPPKSPMRVGYTFNAWNYDFNDPITVNTTIMALWKANANTPYKVEYYLQNLENDNYTLQEDDTEYLTGTTDTTATATKIYEHFTVVESTASANINPDGSTVLQVYYTRDKYTFSTTNEDIRGGSINCTANGTFKYDTPISLSATANENCVFLGWYNNGELFSTSLTFAFGISEDLSLSARWQYYTLTTNVNNTAAGSVTAYDQTAIDVGTSITIKATTNLGYTFIGWYDGDKLITSKLSYSFNMPTENITYIAKWQLKNEMSNFNFTSTPTACTITGVKDKSIYETIVPSFITAISGGAFSGCSLLESITIPNGVRSIGGAAFSGCSSLQEMTIPFVGGSIKTASDTYQYPFGYIFGTSSYTGGAATEQYYYGSSISSTTNTTYYIPSSLKTVTVTGGNILYGAFYNCSGLSEITIPNSVTSIGDYAFRDCSSLTEVTIPDGVTNIGYMAFCDCLLLTSVTIPNSVTSIGDYAFDYCPIEKAKIPALAISFISKRSLKSVEITSGTSVKERAFYGCSSLTSITIPNSVTSIGSSAFYGCSSLTSITIPNSVTSIGSSAFYGCNNLTSVTIPDSVISIGQGAFSGCSSLENITIPFVGGSKTATSADSTTLFGYIFGTSSYVGGTATEQSYSSGYYVTNYIPESLKRVTVTGGNILYGAFYDCRGLTSIAIPNSVTSIGHYAFYDCRGLISITIPNSVTSIRENAFANCSLAEVINKSNLNIRKGSSDYGYIGYYAVTIHNGESKIVNQDGYLFITGDNGNHYLLGYIGADTALILPDNYNGRKYGIYRDAFCNCGSLASITILNSVTSIGVAAFSGCSSLIEVVIPNSVTSIGSSAFSGCSSLTEVTIPNSVTSIGDFVFFYCSGLTIISLPNSITSIGESAFYGCSGLTSITIPNSVTSIKQYAFSGCSSLIEVVIPSSVTSIGYSAFNDCSSLIEITIPDSVTSIGGGAFSDCSSLTKITFADTTTWYRTKDSTGWKNKSGGTNTSVADPSGNATYFKDTYCHYLWYKL